MATEILTRDAGENVGVVLVQILLRILLSKLISLPAFRSATSFLVLCDFLVLLSESGVAYVLIHLVLGIKIDTVHIIEVTCRTT